mgnify:FL=1
MKQDNNIKYQQILELRYEPMPSFLDVKGTLAEQFKQQTEFKFWSISSNRVDFKVTQDGENEKAFVSFKNCGYVVVFPPTQNYFSDKSQKFFKTLFSIENFIPKNFSRLGIKTTIAIPVEKTFEELVHILEQHYFKDIQSLEKLYSGKLTDVGFPLNFKDGDTFFNTQLGAMKKSQLINFFTEAQNIEKDLPEISLFFDIDIFTQKLDNTSIVLNDIRNFSDKTWGIFNNIRTSILE